jgi:hypothetical protein
MLCVLHNLSERKETKESLCITSSRNLRKVLPMLNLDTLFGSCLLRERLVSLPLTFKTRSLSHNQSSNAAHPWVAVKSVER